MTPTKKERRTMKAVAGYVWCDKHCCIHRDTTDPYDSPGDRCVKLDHRKVYVLATKSEGTF